MNLTRLALALGLTALPYIAHAYDGPIHFEAGLGLSTFTTLADGTWYQQGLPHTLNLKHMGATAGFTGELYAHGNWSLRYHLDYVFVGHVSSDAMATPDDANYSVKTHSCIGACLPLAEYVGNGNDQGVVLSLQPTYTFPHDIAVGFEAGIYVHRATWHETVYNWFTPGTTIHADYRPKWQVAPMVGANVSWGNTTISYRYLFNQSHWDATNSVPAIWKGTHMLTIMEVF